jgi:CMP-N-acetylneuraminic acid synthetase
LIGHAITAALETNLDVVLSSENDQILKEGLKFGARMHKRPAHSAIAALFIDFVIPPKSNRMFK